MISFGGGKSEESVCACCPVSGSLLTEHRFSFLQTVYEQLTACGSQKCDLAFVLLSATERKATVTALFSGVVSLGHTPKEGQSALQQFPVAIH